MLSLPSDLIITIFSDLEVYHLRINKYINDIIRPIFYERFKDKPISYKEICGIDVIVVSENLNERSFNIGIFKFGITYEGSICVNSALNYWFNTCTILM